MSALATAPASTCWNCGKALQSRADACLWCGAALATAAAAPVAPAVPAAELGAPPAAHAAPGRPAAAPDALGPAFAGAPARTGARLAAFTVDAVLLAAVGVGILLATGSTALTAAVVIDALVLLWMLEARTGLTPGNALFRIRVSRADRPASPGALRALVRAAVTGAGLIVAGAGAWLVVATSAWDASGRRRSWADAAAGTLAVTVPARSGAQVGSLASRVHLDAAAPDAVALPYASTPGRPPGTATAPLHVGPPLPARSGEDSRSAPATAPAIARGRGDQSHRPSALPLPVTAPPAQPAATGPLAPTPAPAPVPAPAPTLAGVLVLVVDTGQQEQLALPAAAVLGRRPEAQESRDSLITLTDPERTVSKSHLRLEHVEGQTWLTDLGSANGTWLIDEFGEVRQAHAHQRVAVDFGTRIRAGERLVTVHVLGADEATA